MAKFFDTRMDFNIYVSNDHTKPMQAFHTHTNRNELLIVYSGSSTVVTEQSVTHLSGSYAIFYPKGLAHSQINDPSAEYRRCYVCFSSTSFNGVLPQEQHPSEFFTVRLPPDTLARIRVYANMLQKTMTVEFSRRRNNERGHLLSLIFNELEDARELTAVAERCNELPESERLVRDICLYIGESLASDLSIDTIASRFFISRAKLVRVFKQVIGVTVNDYIRTARISRARELLAQELPLAEITRLCGFSSLGYFIKVFRRETGFTPAKYRESLKKGEISGT